MVLAVEWLPRDVEYYLWRGVQGSGVFLECGGKVRNVEYLWRSGGKVRVEGW